MGQNIRYSGVNCALGPSKSIRYSGDFVIAGFVSTYFTVILPGFQMLFVVTGRGLRYSGARYSGVPRYCDFVLNCDLLVVFVPSA